ncbi:hypothetical protein SAMN06265365_11494 [Tistlia consotensis]|uniref:Uncharacterized protein n=1 Tax=Tistlia consotensis USBA 355 TaxID=560819 RepID=A0A1Y6BEH2_9PROT|nr:hypothetical protein [Tistlia consotensis]SME99374.1 hypothetical protein SAMN05428998_102269 [Tistlia consotensis USBA 355]SNR77013.1 hypothetical protein SAMN06265365_11494 [Tistlia consotensis]
MPSLRPALPARRLPAALPPLLPALAAGVLALLALLPPASALTLGEKAALQAAMQQQVERQTIEGVYLAYDAEAQQVRGLSPVTAHPKILEMGDSFILCFDFLDATGEPVQIDYWLARKGDGFVVFHEAVSQRQQVQALMRAGKVKLAE